MKKMKIFTLFLTLFSVVFVYAQQDDEMKMLFTKKDNPDKEQQELVNGGYGSFSVGWTQIDGKDAMVLGGRVAWIANHYFALGLAGRGFFNNFSNNDYYDSSYDPNKDPDYSLSGGYGGLLIEPILGAMKPVHVSFPITIGAGGVSTMPANWKSSYYEPYNYYYSTDAFFLLEPGIDIEFNITNFFRIALGGSYRYTSDVYLEYKYFDNMGTEVSTKVPKDALRGFNVDLSLKFGWF